MKKLNMPQAYQLTINFDSVEQLQAFLDAYNKKAEPTIDPKTEILPPVPSPKHGFYHKQWTKDDIQFLLDHYHHMSGKELSNKLHRAISAVYQKASQLIQQRKLHPKNIRLTKNRIKTSSKIHIGADAVTIE